MHQLLGQKRRPRRPKCSPPSDLALSGWDCLKRISLKAAFLCFSFAYPASQLLLLGFSSFSSETGETNIYSGFRFSFPILLLASSSLSPPIALSLSLSIPTRRRRARAGAAAVAALLLLLLSPSRRGVPAGLAPPAHDAGRWRGATALPGCVAVPRVGPGGGHPWPRRCATGPCRWPPALLLPCVVSSLCSVCAHVLQETLAACARGRRRPAPTPPPVAVCPTPVWTRSPVTAAAATRNTLDHVVNTLCFSSGSPSFWHWCST